MTYLEKKIRMTDECEADCYNPESHLNSNTIVLGRSAQGTSEFAFNSFLMHNIEVLVLSQSDLNHINCIEFCQDIDISSMSAQMKLEDLLGPFKKSLVSFHYFRCSSKSSKGLFSESSEPPSVNFELQYCNNGFRIHTIFIELTLLFSALLRFNVKYFLNAVLSKIYYLNEPRRMNPETRRPGILMNSLKNKQLAEVIENPYIKGSVLDSADVLLTVFRKKLTDDLILFDLNHTIDNDKPSEWLHHLICVLDGFDSFMLRYSPTHSHNIPNFENVQISIHVIHFNNELKFRYKESFFEAFDKTIADLFFRWEDNHSQNEIIQMAQKFKKLGWIYLYEQKIIATLETIVEMHIEKTCKGMHLETKADELKEWLTISVLPFSSIILQRNIITDLEKTFQKHLLRIFCKVRAQELFEMVAEFPDSMSSLRELRDAVATSSSMRAVGKIFRTILKKRLLHPGAATTQILDMYISTIRALRIIDPSDLLLAYVATPVRKYLMSRKDTVRCIVSSLTAGGSSDLHIELRKGGNLECVADEDDEEGGPGVDWEPAKRDVDMTGDGGRGLDVLALLVSIYGSTALFVTEYRSLLAEKLLSNMDYNADPEVANLELLKLRFGDESLHSCEVMLRDLEASKRVNTAVMSDIGRRTPKETLPVDCLLISDNYWPTLRNTDPLNLHPAAAAIITRYQDTYAVLKTPRKLRPLSQLGRVDLDLEFDDGVTRTFSVTPMQATLIMYLSDASKSAMSLVDLASVSELTEELVRRNMGFWIANRVVQERSSAVGGSSGVEYCIIESQDDVDIGNSQIDNDSHGDLMSTQDSAESQMNTNKRLDNYIRGLLSNLETMTIERMHSMLRMMATASTGDVGGEWQFEMNLVQFRRYLQTLVDTDVIELAGDGSCRLRKTF
eukprot:gene4911-9792_t